MRIYETEAFQERVNFAANYISAKRQTTRSFDTCFEMHDGDAVAAALVRRADKNPAGRLAQNLFMYIGEDGARNSDRRLGPNLKIEAEALRYEAKMKFDEFMKRQSNR